VCDLDVMGDPSKLRVIRKVPDFARVRPTLLLSWSENFYFIMNQESES
jgi:hypothetical protein